MALGAASTAFIVTLLCLNRYLKSVKQSIQPSDILATESIYMYVVATLLNQGNLLDVCPLYIPQNRIKHNARFLDRRVHFVQTDADSASCWSLVFTHFGPPQCLQWRPHLLFDGYALLSATHGLYGRRGL